MDKDVLKSLDALEELADEQLAKSVEIEDEAEKDYLLKGVKPDEIAEEGDDEKEDKEDEKDEDASEEEDEKDEDGDDEEDEPKIEKSFNEEIAEDETIKKGLDESEFLSAFARLQGASIDELRLSVAKSLFASEKTASVLAKSFAAIIKSQEVSQDIISKQGEVIKSLQERLDGVEKTPKARKSAVNAIEKSFNASVGVPTELSKSQVSEKLTALAMSGQNGVTIEDVVNYESTGNLRPGLESVIGGA